MMRCRQCLVLVLVVVILIVAFWCKQYPQLLSLNVRDSGRISVLGNSCAEVVPRGTNEKAASIKFDKRARVKLRERKKNVVFLKTHKTGSCSLQNIFYRYGDVRRLNFAFGRYDRFGYPNRISRSSLLDINVANSRTKEYNILASHIRFDYNVVRSFMPNDTEYITILRKPSSVFMSAFRYMKDSYNKCFGLRSNDTLEEFLSKFDNLYNNSDIRNSLCVDVPPHDFGAFDFGLELSDMNNRSIVETKMKEIDSVFSLVMLTEYFDESLILLKDLLNWDFPDIVYFKHNVMNESRRGISESVAERLNLWNNVDKIIYDHFLKKFMKSVEDYGRTRMKNEVKQLRKLIDTWKEACVERNVIANKMGKGNPNRPYHKMTLGFQLRPQMKRNLTCLRLTRPELPYTGLLMKRMKYL